MLVSTRAIVISALKYSEADLIVKLFTEQSGLKSYLLRNVLKSKRGKIRVSQFQPLTQLDIVANHKNKGTLEFLKEVKILHHYKSLHIDILKSSVILFLSEILKDAIQEEEQNENLFEFLIFSFNWFDDHDSPNFHLLFLLKLTKYLGFYPDSEFKGLDYFNLRDGTFAASETNNYCVTGENIVILKQLLGTKFDDLSTIKLNQTNRQGFLNFLLSFYNLHLQGFKTPKSLTVLKELYS